MQEQSLRKVIYLTDNTVMEAIYCDNSLVGIRGVKAKVEQIEHDHVKVEAFNGEIVFLELGDRCQWLPEKEAFAV